MTNSLPARAGFSKPRVAEAGPAALEVRDALAIGPRNAIDQFQVGNTGLRAADVRGGIEDDRAGSHAPVCSRADHGAYGYRCRAAWARSRGDGQGATLLGRAHRRARWRAPLANRPPQTPWGRPWHG